MIKAIQTAASWVIWDTERNPTNLTTDGLRANTTDGDTSGFDIDILSNGFKVRDAESTLNTNGNEYLFVAFTEHPFKNSRAH